MDRPNMLGLSSQTWSGLDVTPVVYIYGNRTTHTDIMCTTNTTKAQQDSAAATDPSFLPTVMKFKLPYEVSDLFMVADRYITKNKTPIEEQHLISSRNKQNRLLRNEQKAFTKRLWMDRMERFNKESSASVKIQSSYRGHMTRLRLQMEKEKINYDTLRVVQDYRTRVKGRKRSLLKFEGCMIPGFYKEISTEIRMMAIELGLPPIEGYTLNQHPNSTSRTRGRQAIEHSSATNMARNARGYLTRKCSATKEVSTTVRDPAVFLNKDPILSEGSDVVENPESGCLTLEILNALEKDGLPNIS